MKKYILPVCCFAALTASAQQENTRVLSNPPKTEKEKIAVITGHMENSPNDTLVQLWDPYNGFFDTARIKNNRFTLHTPMPHGGGIYVLTIGSMASHERPNVRVVYVEEGNMRIAGKGTDLKNAKLSGDAYVKDWNEVYNMIKPEQPENIRLQELEAKFREAMAVGDEDAAEAYNSAGDTILNNRREWMRKWISAHRTSGVASYVASSYFSAKERKQQLAMLEGAATETRIYKRAMFPGKYDPLPVGLKVVDRDSAAAGKFGNLAVGMDAPQFSAPDVNGKTVSLADYKGKFVFVDFWASWCGPCKPQIPFLKAANAKFRDQNFVMLAVSLDTKKEAWMKAIAKHELDWINLSGLKGWNEEAAKAYGVQYIPFNVLISPEGKVLAMNIPGKDVEARLAAFLESPQTNHQH